MPLKAIAQIVLVSGVLKLGLMAYAQPLENVGVPGSDWRKRRLAALDAEYSFFQQPTTDQVHRGATSFRATQLSTIMQGAFQQAFQESDIHGVRRALSHAGLVYPVFNSAMTLELQFLPTDEVVEPRENFVLVMNRSTAEESGSNTDRTLHPVIVQKLERLMSLCDVPGDGFSSALLSSRLTEAQENVWVEFIWMIRPFYQRGLLSHLSDTWLFSSIESAERNGYSGITQALLELRSEPLSAAVDEAEGGHFGVELPISDSSVSAPSPAASSSQSSEWYFTATSSLAL